VTPKTSAPRPKPADPRVPFPDTARKLACRENPERFSHEKTAGAEKDIALAKADCQRCPIVEGCLKWALANPHHTHVGVWAATTPRHRTTLRQRLKKRLGEDWVGAMVAKDRERAAHRARIHPPTTREEKVARLELELIPTRPTPYVPERAPISAEQAAANRDQLRRALTTAEAGTAC
jgi:hypothetical protein